MAERFTHEITVTWGDCDPAQIVYTGRIPNFCLDAINAFCDAHLGGGWFFQELDHNIGMPFVNMTIDFRAPVTPRHRLVCSVAVEKLGSKSVTFRVEGHQDGGLCFEGSFTEVFTIADQFKSREIPADIRTVLEKHRIK
ncbi:MAG TPA: acyl-CoA thioesterase [Maritimibacter sp.]|nr:acyl-CoA thioesterase [Maritimibacter sp.]